MRENFPVKQKCDTLADYAAVIEFLFEVVSSTVLHDTMAPSETQEKQLIVIEGAKNRVC